MIKMSGENIKVVGESIDSGVINALDEVLWHAATLDESIVKVSQEHLSEIVKYAKAHFPAFENRSVRFLEVASYA